MVTVQSDLSGAVMLDSIWFDSMRFDSIRFDSTRCALIGFNLIQFNATRSNSILSNRFFLIAIWYDSVRFHALGFELIRFDSTQRQLTTSISYGRKRRSVLSIWMKNYVWKRLVGTYSPQHEAWESWESWEILNIVNPSTTFLKALNFSRNLSKQMHTFSSAQLLIFSRHFYLFIKCLRCLFSQGTKWYPGRPVKAFRKRRCCVETLSQC